MKRIYFIISSLFIGFLAIGGVVGAIDDAQSVISPLVSTVLTFSMFALYILVKTYVSRNKVHVSDKKNIYIKSLGYEYDLFVIGAIILVWLPSLIHFIRDENVSVSKASDVYSLRMDSTKLSIILLPFKRSSGGKNLDVNLQDQIAERFEGMNLNYDYDIQLVVIDSFHTNNILSDADKITRVTGADIVLFGNYQVQSDSELSISLKYVLSEQNSKNYMFNRYFSTRSKHVNNVDDLRYGFLQGELEFVINFIKSKLYLSLGEIEQAISAIQNGLATTEDSLSKSIGYINLADLNVILSDQDARDYNLSLALNHLPIEAKDEIKILLLSNFIRTSRNSRSQLVDLSKQVVQMDSIFRKIRNKEEIIDIYHVAKCKFHAYAYLNGLETDDNNLSQCVQYAEKMSKKVSDNLNFRNYFNLSQFNIIGYSKNKSGLLDTLISRLYSEVNSLDTSNDYRDIYTASLSANLALIYTSNYEIDKALNVADKSINTYKKIFPNIPYPLFSGYYAKAICYSVNGIQDSSLYYYEAINEYRVVSDTLYSVSDMYFDLNYGAALFGNDKFEESLIVFQRAYDYGVNHDTLYALMLAGSISAANMELGNTTIASSQVTKAINDFEMAYVNSTNPKELTLAQKQVYGILIFNYSEIMCINGKYEIARELLEKGINVTQYFMKVDSNHRKQIEELKVKINTKSCS